MRTVVLAAWVEFEVESKNPGAIPRSMFEIDGPNGGLPRVLASLPRLEPGKLGTYRLGVGGSRSAEAFSDMTATDGAFVEGPESRERSVRKALAVGLGAVLLRFRV